MLLNEVCYEVSIAFAQKMYFSLEVDQNRSSVLTTTSDRSWISDKGNVNFWYKRKFNPKI